MKAAAKEASFRPLYDNVVIEPIEEGIFTPGGIRLPDSAVPQPNRGRVLAVGDGPLLTSGQCGPMPLKVGDVILFPRGGAMTINVGGEEFSILPLSRVIGVVT